MSEALYSLVQSLTKNEKRYFKIYSSLHVKKGKNNYVKLFDLIEQMKSYNETIIQRKFFNNKVFLKNISYNKHYLQQQIVSSLSAYYSQKTADNELLETIQSIIVLYKKAQFQLGYSMLKGAIKKAQKYQKYHFELILLYWKRLYKSSMGNVMKSNDSILEEETSALKRLEKISQIQYLTTKIDSTLLSLGRKTDAKTNSALKSMMSSPLLKKQDLSLSNYEKLIIANTWHNFFLYQRNLEKATYYIQEVIKLEENHPEGLDSRLNRYINHHKSLVYYLIEEKNYGKADETLQKVKAIYKNANIRSSQIEADIAFIEITVLIRKMLVEKIELDTQNINNQLEVYEKKMPLNNWLIICIDACQLLFVNQKFDECRYWLEKIIHAENILLGDVQSFAMIFRIILNYEADDDMLLESSIRSCYRMLLKKRELSFEKSIFPIFRKLYQITDPSKAVETFVKINEVIKSQENTPYNYALVKAFGIDIWLESKIKKQPIKDLIKQKLL